MVIAIEDAVLALSGSVLVILATLSVANLFLKIRRKFRVRVNCWFCNGWTRVPYNNRNAFECPSCYQYNGFDSSGDYNRTIPAQYDELLNVSTRRGRGISRDEDRHKKASNGLCQICNNNLQLKIFQLANFVPLREENYDLEIKHFENQLERSYKLCSACKDVVDETIQKQNNVLGIRLAQPVKKASIRNLEVQGLSSTRHVLPKTIVCFFLLALAVVNLITFGANLYPFVKIRVGWTRMIRLYPILRQLVTRTTNATNFIVEKLPTMDNNNFWLDISFLVDCWNNFETAMMVYVNRARDFSPAIFDEAWNFISKLSIIEGVFYDAAVKLGLVGILLQLILMVVWKGISNSQLLQLAVWSLMVGSQFKSSSLEKVQNFYLNWFQIACSIVIIFLIFNSSLTKRKKSTAKHYPKKKSTYFSNPVKDFSQINEINSLNNTAKSTFTYVDAKPNFEAFKSHYESPIFNFSSTKPTFGRPAFTNFRSNNDSSFCDSYESSTYNFSCNPCPSVTTVSPKHHSSFLSVDKQYTEIDKILHRLNLGEPQMSKRLSPPTFTAQNVFEKNSSLRPSVLSPAKLKTSTQNSWVAGGFWLDSENVSVGASCAASPFSRSSSQTSGFASQNEQPLPTRQNPWGSVSDYGGEVGFECRSVLSEPLNGRSLWSSCHHQRNSINHANQYYRRPTTVNFVGNEQMSYFAPSPSFRTSLGNNVGNF